jgi:hypothetical protein
MAKKDSKLSIFPPNSAELENMLQAGYPGMTKEVAEGIINERKVNPLSYPYEEELKAKAFLAALSTAPVAVSTDLGWKRKRT